jgi:hypothetical protein
LAQGGDIMLNKYTKDKNILLSDNENTRTLEGTPSRESDKNSVDINAICENIKRELIFYGTNYGELNYRLAKAIYEKTKDLTYTDTHRVYGFIQDFLGMKISTIKNLVKIYSKLAKFNLWHNETGLFKLRLFQIAYYIDKNTTESDRVLEQLYYDIMNNFNLRNWFSNATFKEILDWFKTRFETYLRKFRKIGLGIPTCDICNRELKNEEFRKNWDYLPICFTCYDFLKEENKDKLAILRNKIKKMWKDTKIQELETKLNETKQKLMETIQEYDNLRLRVSKRYKKIMAKIND